MTKLFLSMLGSIFDSEDTTTALRLIDAALDARFEVQVWACGGATLLTSKHLGVTRPRNFLELGTDRSDNDYPTSAALVTRLMERSDNNLHWCVCRHCLEERGAHEHIAGVEITAPFRYARKMSEADISLVIGKW